ncbi:MAG: class I SAM-dependent methyltransferase [Chthoniobacter sp.]|nr:class I SAM-dependent methyltransferase [Chthoniobacter sp.]
MIPERTILSRPTIAITDSIPRSETSERWLEVLRGILHEKDKNCGLYTLDPNTYPTYYNIGSVLRPTSLLEVGVRFGYSLASLASGAELKNQVYGVDREMYEKNSNSYAINALKSLSIDAHLFTGTSDDFDVKRNTGLSSIDLIHIDGDHTTPGALKDLLHYSNFSNRILVDDVLDSRVWAAVKAFVSLQDRLVSQTYFKTATGLMLLEL